MDNTAIHHCPALLSASPAPFAKGPPPAVSPHSLVFEYFLLFWGSAAELHLGEGWQQRGKAGLPVLAAQLLLPRWEASEEPERRRPQLDASREMGS